MNTIGEIYERYHVPPHLQNHMYSVAALGQLLVDHLHKDVVIDTHLLTTVNLLHDIGNIIKFDFRPGKLFGIPVGEEEYWRKMQQEFIEKYGTDEHAAVNTIAKELGLPEKAVMLLGHSSLAKIEYALETDDWTVKILRICDERLSPQGVVTVRERYADIFARYEGRNHHLANKELTEKRMQLVLQLEKMVQSKADINMQTITTDMLTPYMTRLKEFVI